MSEIIKYFVTMFSPNNVWALIIAFSFIAYLQTHATEHKMIDRLYKKDQKDIIEWRSEVKHSFTGVEKTLGEVKHILDEYLFKFESASNKEARQRMDSILSRVKAKTSVIEMKLKTRLSSCSGDDVEKTVNDCFNIIITERQEVIDDILQDGYGQQVVRAMQKVSEMLAVFLKDKLKHIVGIACDNSLNGSKPYAIEAMVCDLENQVYQNWERILTNELRS